MPRQLNIEIFRYDPNRPEREPFMQPYTLMETTGMTLFMALNRLRETRDPTLMFDFVCRSSVCGSCAMIVNGINRMACRTLTSSLSSNIRLLPMPFFKLLGDLTVDTHTWFRGLDSRLRAWIHDLGDSPPDKIEEPMDNMDAFNVYNAERCIECGCCISGCATMANGKGFLGAAGLNRMARFMMDPRDNRKSSDYLEIVGTDEGLFACFETMMCEDNCPLDLPVDLHMEYVRKKVAAAKTKLTKTVSTPTPFKK
ncbi:MAG: fumarate reductase iron-sulfur subunit [Deltaproteobacteria bacterium]|nr:fumarate reductase iron-sulfur subunit [Deltaproteobacteria bacterium]